MELPALHATLRSASLAHQVLVYQQIYNLALTVSVVYPTAPPVRTALAVGLVTVSIDCLMEYVSATCLTVQSVNQEHVYLA